MKKLICLGIILLCSGMAWAYEGLSVSTTPDNLYKDNTTTTPYAVIYVPEIKETPHRIRFIGVIHVGGEIVLSYKNDYFDESDAFKEWLDSLTVKELRENWGIDLIRHREVPKEGKE